MLPQSVKGFRLLHELGGGEHGVVWLAEAEDAVGNSRYAIKIPAVKEESTISLLEEALSNEQRTLQRLGEHPHIALLNSIVSVVTDEGVSLGVVTKFVEGGLDFQGEAIGSPLDTYLIGSTTSPIPLDIEKMVLLLCQVCDALHHAHEMKIYHGYLKPNNILVRSSDRSAIVVDWGTSKVIDAISTTPATTGSRPFLSPEAHYSWLRNIYPRMPPPLQAIDGRTDIFSLGITAIYLILGELPFTPENLQMEVADLEQRDRVESSLIAEVGDVLAEVLMRAINYIPANRPTATEFKNQLRKAMGWSEEHSVVVKPLVTVSRLTLTSEPIGAMVTIDDVEVGKTPCTYEIKTGIRSNRSVVVGIGELPGYEDAVFELLVGRGETQTRHVALERQPQQEFDRLAAEEANKEGIIFHYAKRHIEALNSFKRAIEIDLTYAAAYDNLGDVYRVLKRYEEAEASYKHAVELEPKYKHPYNGLGNVYYDMKRYSEAEASFKRSIDLDPNFAAPHNGLGNLYRDQKRRNEAEASYLRAIELDPNDKLTYNVLGHLYYEQKRYEEAEQNYKQSIKLDQTFKNPYYGLGNVYYNTKRYSEAEANYKRAIKLDPNYQYPHIGLGNTYFIQGCYPEAEASYLRAINIDPNEGLYYANLASCYLRMNRKDDAKDAANRAKALGYQDKGALAA